MGYYTYFTGELLFTKEQTKEQLDHLATFCGLDIRKRPDLVKEYGNIYHIDYMISEDECGIEWNEAEKSYDMLASVNLIIKEMRKKWPDFGLTGTLEAYGEEQGDRWRLWIDEKTGLAREQDYPKVGGNVVCPHCKKEFKLDLEEKC